MTEVMGTEFIEMQRRVDILPRNWFKRRKAVAEYISEVGLPTAKIVLAMTDRGIVNREIDTQEIIKEERYLAEEKRLSRALIDGKFIVSKGE